MSQPESDKPNHPSLEQPTKREALKDEYLLLQQAIGDFNQQSLTIKNWSVVFGFASIGVAFTAHREWVLIVSALSAGTFWILGGLWKAFQHAYYERVHEIEAYFRGDRVPPEPFQINTSFWASWNKNRWHGFFVLTQSWVYLPHLVVVLIALTLFALVKLSLFEV